VTVHLFGQLLAETLRSAEARAFVLDRICTEQRLDLTLAASMRAFAENVGPTLGHHAVGRRRGRRA
jgi:arginine deiminase